MTKMTYDEMAAQLAAVVAERDAALNAERIWETAMMEVCGEDGPASVSAVIKALAAENQALKDSNRKLINEQQASWPIGLLDSFIAEHDPETPATDAALAAIQAQGVNWIEGNAPPDFGRYWVRYETDVGPQYCSAKWLEYNFCASSDTNIHKIWLADNSRSINPLLGVTHYTKLPKSLEELREAK
ncbi:TPA: hypothetical protein ACG0BA_004437 [Serratia odorifera]